MAKQISALLFLAVVCLVTLGNCLQLQHESALYQALLIDGNCKYGYVVSLDGVLWDKAPLNAPQNIGDFLTNQQVSFEGITYYLRSDAYGRREYNGGYRNPDNSVYMARTNTSYIIGIWDQSDTAMSCIRQVTTVFTQKMEKGY